MQVTGYTKKRNDVIITFDNDSQISLRYDIFVKYSFRKGLQVDEKWLQSVIFESEYYVIKEKAFLFISLRPHSAYEIKRKLLMKKFNADVIDKVVQELKDRNYINDLNFAKLYTAELLAGKTGPIMVEAKLFQRGISKDIIRQVVSEFANPDDIYKNAKELAIKKVRLLKEKETNNLKIKQKLYSFLAGKGFDFEVINNIADEIIKD